MDLQPQFDWISRLVAFDTTSRNSNLPLIEDVESYIADFGIEGRRVPNAEGTKANLYFSVGPDVAGGVVLSGHTDVVPVDGQDWASDPWTVTPRDGRLFGRGTCDMKGFVAIALSLLPEMAQADLKKPIHFALSYDEEIGLLGAPSMIAEMRERVPEPSAVIVGEPTNMEVVSGHKGIAVCRTMVRGHEAHSSQIGAGVSAIMTANRLISKLVSFSEESRETVELGSPFDPPHSTITVGLIEGGTASNILAKRCEFVWDVRVVPGERAGGYFERFDAYCREVEAEMKQFSPDCEIVNTVIADGPPLDPSKDNEASELARALTGENRMHSVAYAAEAGQFQVAGFPTVICGPGSILQAHQPNEYLEIAQVEKCATFLRRLIERLS